MANIFEFRRGSTSGTLILGIPEGRGSIRWKNTITEPEEDNIPGEVDIDYWDQGTRKRVISIEGRLNKSDDDIADYLDLLDGLEQDQYDNDSKVVLRVKVEGAWKDYDCVVTSVDFNYPPGQPTVLEYRIELVRISSILTI